ncbi:MAG: quinolinate synthase NadA [Bacteroidales bacterium]|nr:quinolinate synthase NadA [Bacteroidales bacterium]MBN2699564.1 quinolinate synthase NadA [Bacteroidales bacterium]
MSQSSCNPYRERFGWLPHQKPACPGKGVPVNRNQEIPGLKAVSDICCTSANAVNAFNSLAGNTILFVPDMNLDSYVSEKSARIAQNRILKIS